jgi:hypothetical protein
VGKHCSIVYWQIAIVDWQECFCCGLLPDAFAIVSGLDLDFPAHFVKARSHLIADALAESAIPQRCSRIFKVFVPTKSRAGNGILGLFCNRTGAIEKVSSDNRRAFVVVALVEDVRDGVSLPLSCRERSEIIEHQHFGLKDGLQDVKFSRLNRRIIRIPDLFQELSIIAEKARNILGPHQLFHYANCQVRFTRSIWTDKKQSGAIDRIVFNKLMGHQSSMGERTIVFTVVVWGIGLEVRNLTALVSAGNPG